MTGEGAEDSMAVSSRMREACARYGAAGGGQVAFGKFASATREDWERLAADVLRRWKVPEHRGEVEDVSQEMLIGALKAFRKYDPSEGTPLEEYVVWTALAYAKTRVHKLRGACMHGNVGKNPSRIERPFSSFGESRDGDGERTSEGVVEACAYAAGMVEAPAQEERFEFEERRSEVRQVCSNAVEEIVVEVTFEGFGLERSAERLYDDPDACLAYRIGSEDGARRLVSIAALALAERVAEELVA